MDKKIKVGMIGLQSFFYTNKIAHYLSSRPDIDLHLIAPGDRTEDTKENNVNLYTIRVKKPSPLIFLSVPSIKNKITEINPDIMHGVQQDGWSRAVALVRDKYPTVLTMMGAPTTGIAFLDIFIAEA